jgi:ATP-dependent helicase HrpA
LDLGRGIKQKIGHTQPRRIAARSVSSRIAEELNVELGHEVGFKVRFTDKTSAKTKIKLMTDGVLLAETQADPLLKKYDTLIIDEAHERNLNIDFLIGFIKQILPKRPDLKVIITSATIDVEKFSTHFNNAPTIEISGRTFPVETKYRPMENVDENNVMSLEESVLKVIQEIGHQSGDVLVFLPGEKDIHDIRRYLNELLKDSHEVLPLFSRLPVSEQQKIFSKGVKKRIILSTNIAETSLTVPNIKFVIDSGLARVVRYNPKLRIEQLLIEKISQAATEQRKGRCGRVAPGVCFRLFDEDDFSNRDIFTDPEITRSSLASVILRMSSLKLGDVEKFPFIDAPSKKFIQDGYDLLFELHAVEKDRKITELGKVLAQIPIDPIFSRILLEAKKQQCLTEVLPIISAISVADPIERPFDKQEQAEKAQFNFHHPKSSFMSFYKLWQLLLEEVKTKKIKDFVIFCKKYFLSFTRMREWQEMHKQLLQIVQELGYKLNEKEATYDQIHQSLLSGLLRNIGFKEIDGINYLGCKTLKFIIGPKQYRNKKFKWIMAAEIIDTGKFFAQCVAEINNDWIEKYAKHLLEADYSNPRWNKKLARVDATQKLSLFGLTIVPERSIHYGPINPEISKDIFIRQGLVENQYISPGNFYKENQILIKEIENLEHKSRRRDILINDDVLYDFYYSKVDQQIINGDGFEFWRKAIEKSDPRRLFLTREYLMQHDANAVTEMVYPNQIKLNDYEYQLKYHFEPGHPRDGLTISFPLSHLNLIEDNELGWLVPGLLNEKVTWAFKNLPKVTRRKCIPVKDWVEKFLRTPRLRSFKETFTKFIWKYVDANFRMTKDFLADLPSHLKIKFEITNDQGKMIDLNEDLEILKKENQSIVKKKIEKVKFDIEDDDIRSWPISELPYKVSKSVGGKLFEAYPGFVDYIESISIEIFDNPTDADSSHINGVKRLVKQHFRERLNRFKKNPQDLTEAILALSPWIGKADLIDNLIDVMIDEATGEKYLIKTQIEFDNLINETRNKLPKVIDQIALNLNHISQEYIKIQEQRNTHSYVNEIDEDIDEQLEILLPPYEAPLFQFHFLNRIPIYIKTLGLRIDKYPQRNSHDHESITQYNRLKNKWVEKILGFVENDIEIPKPFIDFQWQLQELRISFFAQELKTLKPISIKRMDRAWSELLKLH